MTRKKISMNNSTNINSLVSIDRPEQTSITLQNFIKFYEDFLNSKALQGLAPRTIKDYKNHMEFLKKYFEAEKRFDMNRYLDASDFVDYLSYMLLQKQYKPCTVNIRLRTLKCYLKWLYDEKYIPNDFSSKLKLVKVPQDTIKPLNDYQIKKIFKVLDTNTYSGFRDFTLMILMLDTGIRVGEATEIKIEHIDINAKLINIPAENAKTRVFRTVPISPKTIKLLKELIKKANENQCDYIFQSSYGGQIDKMVIIKNFEKYGKRAGIGVRCTPHVWRHTMATNAVKSGLSIFYLQRILGHNCISTTRKYIQLDNLDLLKKHNQYSMIDKIL